jgi:GH35 family endo-1,4-beta-xylanase
MINKEPIYEATLAREFNYVTPENDMKWQPIEPQPGQWNWGPADGLVAFAQSHGMAVKGHCLVWHNQLPSWMTSMTDPTQVRAALVDHITTEVSHYKGQLRAWDVVNEAVLDDGSGYRPNVFYDTLGPDYIALAFQTAHAAEPDAILNYNDYGAEGRGPKSDFVYSMLSHLVSTGVPVTGVGLQMHISADSPPSAADVAWNIHRLGALGLHVNISEMDVLVGQVSGTTAHKFDVQKQVYHGIVGACVGEPQCDALTFWGFTDAHTWIDKFVGPGNFPLLFDDSYAKKPAYFGVLAALLGM